MPISCPKCRTENASDSKFCRECSTPLPAARVDAAAIPTVTAQTPLRELATGTTFAGRYRIIEEIGHGGMGRVYKAFDTRLGEKVAIKLVRPEIASDRAVVERFANEIRLTRRITHRNVCRMHDLGEEQGTPYITMEYVSGEDLKSMLRMTGGLSPGQTVAIGAQIASGLAEAHRLGVVHRDLKPHNVMIDREGAARIMDFGIAHSAVTKGITDRGAMIGTPEYMSPEQAEGDEVDARSDIYSLGVMLFEMATGKLPFEGRSAIAIAMRHKGEAPPDPSAVNPRVPSDLSRIILRCLEKDRSARYQSVEEVRSALDGLAHDLPAATPARPQRPATTGETAAARGWRKTAALVAAGLVLIVAAALAWRFVAGRSPAPAALGSARARNSVAVVGFDNQTGDPRFDHLRKAIPSLIITSLENTGRFKVVTWERMKDVLSQAGRKDVDIIDAEGGFDVCRREGIAYVVVGSFTKAGDFFATDVKVLDAENRALVKSVTSRGEGENSILRTQIDDIGRGIASGLAPTETATAAPATQVIDVTTSSMEAYTAYLKGSDALAKFTYEPAVRELQKAVEVDPAFAVAHLALSEAYSRLGDQNLRKKEIGLAKLHSAKATERERLMIEATYALLIEHDWDKRVALLQKLVTRYPQDKEAHFDLGFAYWNLNMTPEAAASYQRALDLDPNYGLALNSMAFLYLDLGKADLAVQCLQKYAAVSPGDPNPLDSLADVQFRLGHLDEAAASWQRTLAIAPDFGSDVGLAAVAALKEDYETALRWTNSAVEHATAETRKADGYGFRALLLQLTGRQDAARASMRLCREIMARAGTAALADTLRGWLEYDNHAWDESRKAFRNAREAQRKASADPLHQMWYDTFLALVDQAARDVTGLRARIDQFQPAGSASAGVPHKFTASSRQIEEFSLELNVRRLRASALLAEGRIDEAIAQLRPVWPGPLPVWYFEPVVAYYCPLVQDDLARLYVQKQDWDRAIAEYKVLTAIGPEHQNRRLVHPVYHYRLAQVYEKKEMTREAIGEYQRFLKALQKAERVRPEMTEAHKRLAALGAPF